MSLQDCRPALTFFLSAGCRFVGGVRCDSSQRDIVKTND